LLRALMIAQLLYGLVSSYSGWLSAIEEVQRAFSLAVAVEL